MRVNRSESKYFNSAVRMDDALIQLLAEKPFEYITVSEICKRAQVNRSTFYLHYDNTSELLAETTRRMLDGFLTYFTPDMEAVRQRFSSCGLEELHFITPEYLHPYLRYIRDNRIVFSTALAHMGSFGCEEIFQRLFEHILNPVLERFHYPVASRKYAILFYLNGITAIASEWIRGQCKEPVEEIAGMIRTCVYGLYGSENK